MCRVGSGVLMIMCEYWIRTRLTLLWDGGLVLALWHLQAYTKSPQKLFLTFKVVKNKEKNNYLTTITKVLNPFGQKPGLVVSELNQ